MSANDKTHGSEKTPEKAAEAQKPNPEAAKTTKPKIKGSGMQKIGKEVKIGLAVIGVLLVAFGYVFYKRLAQPDEAAAATTDVAATTPSDTADHPTVVAATETDRPSHGPKRSPFSLDSSRKFGGMDESKGADPIAGGPQNSFMPAGNVASDSPPEHHFGDFHHDNNSLRHEHEADAPKAADNSPVTPSDPFHHHFGPPSDPAPPAGPDVVAAPPSPPSPPLRPVGGFSLPEPDGFKTPHHPFESEHHATADAPPAAPPNQFSSRNFQAPPDPPAAVASATDQPPHHFGHPVVIQNDPPVAEPPQTPPAEFHRHWPASPPASYQATPEAPPQQLAIVTATPKPGQYVVQPNDNFWTISEKVYGNGGYFKAIYEYNRRQHPRPERLQVGETLDVPDSARLQKDFPDLCPKPSRMASAPGRVTPASARMQPNTRVYVVEEGDTLFEIARRELGRPARWGEIYQLNREALGNDFDYLKPGTELLLPSDSRPESMAREPSGTLSR